MYRNIGVLITSLACLAGTARANDISELEGHWRTVRHNAEVNITDCGDGSPCGYLIAVSEDVSGGETRDVRNGNRNLRARPLNGLPILWGYSAGKNCWENGRLYNPETGQTFRSSIHPISKNELQVKGCLGPFCRQQIWRRIDQPDHANNRSNTND